MANKRLLSLALTVALGAANLIALNYLISGWSTARVDLTQEGLYSISPATRRLLTTLDEPVTIYGYFSTRTHPKLAPLVPELVDLLEEYRAVSGGRVAVEILDPSASEEIEEEASERYGVSATPFRLATKNENAIVNAYFAVVIKYADQYVRYGFRDLIQINPAPDGDIDVALRNPEYDLTRAIKKVVFGFRGTDELFDRVSEPVRVTAVWTASQLPELFSKVPEALRAAAQELEQVGGDKFTFEEIDPGTDESMAREVARRYGAQPMSLGIFGGNERFYLHALLAVGERMELLPLTAENVTAATIREAVENSLRRNTPGFLKTIGIVTPDEDQIPPELRMQLQMPPPTPPQFNEIQRYLEQDYSVRKVELGRREGVPYEVDVLLALKPQDLSETELYNLDQYLMRGGRVILCAGNYNVDFGAQGFNVTRLNTGLDAWLEHHGIKVGSELVLDDRNQPLPVPRVRQTPFGALRTWSLEPYPYLVQVREDGFLNPEITSTLDAVGIYWGSALEVDEARTSSMQILPILQSSDRSWTRADASGVNEIGYSLPADGLERRTLALAVSGKFTSYYKDREPPSFEPALAGPTGESPTPDASQPSIPLEQSPETRLVVVGNSEFLSDFVADALSQVEGGFFIENLRFAQNLIDWTTLDNEMLSIRARGMISRRLDRTTVGQRGLIEGLNYVVPVLLLGMLGGYLYRRRKNRPSLAAGRPVVKEVQA